MNRSSAASNLPVCILQNSACTSANDLRYIRALKMAFLEVTIPLIPQRSKFTSSLLCQRATTRALYNSCPYSDFGIERFEMDPTARQAGRHSMQQPADWYASII